jgi:hypothetical protein
MKKPILAATLVALTTPFLATFATAGPIEKACLSSDRRGVSRAMCGCIQEVADLTLRDGDQRKAAKFFTDPDRAQDVRMSSRDADNAFWDRYKNFGVTAEAYCAG